MTVTGYSPALNILALTLRTDSLDERAIVKSTFTWPLYYTERSV